MSSRYQQIRQDRFTLRKLLLETSLLAILAAFAGTIGRSFGEAEVRVFLLQLAPLVVAWRAGKHLHRSHAGVLAATLASLMMVFLVVVDASSIKTTAQCMVGIALTLATFTSYFFAGVLAADAERKLSDILCRESSPDR